MKTPQVVIASVLMALLMMNTAAAAQEYPYKVLVEDFEGGIFEQLDDTKWNRDSWWNGEGTANHQGTIFRELIVEDGALQFNADQTALSSAQTLEVFPGLRVLPMVRGDLKFQANVGVAVTGEAGKYWNGVVRMRLDLAGISDNRVEVGIKKGQSEGCDGCSYYKAYLKKKVSGEWVDIGGNYSDGKEFKLDLSAVDVLGDETLLSLTTQDGVLTARLGDTEIGHVSIWDGKYSPVVGAGIWATAGGVTSFKASFDNVSVFTPSEPPANRAPVGISTTVDADPTGEIEIKLLAKDEDGDPIQGFYGGTARRGMQSGSPLTTAALNGVP